MHECDILNDFEWNTMFWWFPMFIFTLPNCVTKTTHNNL